jgi:hypothetical protein
MAKAMLPPGASDKEVAGLYLLDRGYRSGALFNRIVAVGGD